jgi:pimeloyl-ACP methyl ester carboxylesterase
VNDLRAALGVAKWNLYGVSYGTRLALTVMRDFPKGVRSVTLDSVYPPQVDLYASFASHVERALNLLFDGCAADPACNAAYPDIKTIFYDTVAQLDAKPVTLSLIQPVTAKSYPVVMNGDSLISLTFQLLYYSNVLVIFPKLIYELHAGGGFNSILLPYLPAWLFANAYSSEGMGLSVQCGEEASFSSPQAVATGDAAVFPRLREAFSEIPTYSTFATCAA